ncbi:helix-turn-helix transcriptional regulator [Eggerthellaceae bacterium zg-997]|nr:helix-turn-helix transcriptional regulator [Eggerthellaceae bacterium zg-997]
MASRPGFARLPRAARGSRPAPEEGVAEALAPRQGPSAPGAIGGFRFLALATLGYGLQIVLLSLVGWPGAPFAFLPPGAPASAAEGFVLARNIAYCAAFFVWAAVSLKGGAPYRRLCSSPALYALFPAAIALALGLSLLPADARSGSEYASGALMGVGVSGNFALWQHVLCSRRTPLDARCLIGGTIAGGLLYFLFASLPTWVVTPAVALVVAPGTAVLIYWCARGIDDVDRVRTMPSVAERRERFNTGLMSLLMPCVTIGAIGLIMQAVRTSLLLAEPTEAAAGGLFSGALIVGALALLVVLERTGYRVNMDVFYRVFAPVIAVALLALPVLGEWYLYALMACLYVVFNIASIMGILACAQAARHYRIPPIAIYAFSFGVIYTARYLPGLAMAGIQAAGLDPAPAYAPARIATMGVFVLFAAYVASDRFLSRQHETQVFSWESSLRQDGSPVFRVTHEGIAEFARREGLTEREAEVLAKLREGRSAPYIAEAPCVTESTVKYHCKNIYRKLGVHSRQELFDLLDRRIAGAEQ